MKKQKQLNQQKSQKEQVLLLEDKDGFTMRVPSSKLEEWKRAQQEPDRPLNQAEKQVVENILRRIYGDKK